MDKNKRLRLYRIAEDYFKHLYKFDSKIMISNEEKSNRPFIGVILRINNINYFAPLTSPKSKHLTMKNSLDFLKVKGGEYGAINFNNMIPVPMNQASIITFKNITDIAYANLLENQYIWCNDNKEKILKVANKLYTLYLKGRIPLNVKDRCVNFILMEEKCLEYQLNLDAMDEVAITIDENDNINTENQEELEN